MFQLPLCHCDIEALLIADKMLYVGREYTFMAAGCIELHREHYYVLEFANLGLQSTLLVNCLVLL